MPPRLRTAPGSADRRRPVGAHRAPGTDVEVDASGHYLGQCDHVAVAGPGWRFCAACKSQCERDDRTGAIVDYDYAPHERRSAEAEA